MAKIEVFTGGSDRCEEVLQQVQELACSNCEIVTYDLSKDAASAESEDRAREYGVQSIPAVVINGRLVDYETVKNARLGRLEGEH